MAKQKFDDFEIDENEFITDLPVGNTPDTNIFDITLIKPNPHQPRFKEEVEELKASIEGAYQDLLRTHNYDNTRIQPEHGLLQPIIITPNEDDTYTLVGGHRRFKACSELGHKTIKANEIKLDKAQLITFSLVENVQRKDLSALETALQIDKAIMSGAFDKEQEIADIMGFTHAKLSKFKSVLKLPDVIKDDIHKSDKKIGLEILVDLQRLLCSTTQEDLYFKYKKGEIKGSDIRDEIKKQKQGKVIAAPILKITPYNAQFNIDFKEVGSLKVNDFKEELIEIVNKLKAKYDLSAPLKQPDIKLMEIFDNNVYIEYEDNNSHTVTFNETKKIIQDAPQWTINYSIGIESEKSLDFIQNIPNRNARTGDDNKSYLTIKI